MEPARRSPNKLSVFTWLAGAVCIPVMLGFRLGTSVAATGGNDRALLCRPLERRIVAIFARLLSTRAE